MCCFGDSYSIRSSKKEYERNLLFMMVESQIWSKNYPNLYSFNKWKNHNYFTWNRYVISAKFAVVPGEVSAPVGVTLTL
jgi:hypothetical protein